MGHDISVKFNGKTVCEIKIPAFDLATSYAFYESLGALDFHSGVSGTFQTMKLNPSVLTGALLKLARIKNTYSLQEWHEKIKHTRQATIINEEWDKMQKLIEHDFSKEEVGEKKEEVGECGYTLVSKMNFLANQLMRISKALAENKCGLRGVTIYFA